MKELQINLTLHFADKIYSDEEIQEVLNNVLSSLKHGADTAGLAPEQSETYTEKISATIPFNVEISGSVNII